MGTITKKELIDRIATLTKQRRLDVKNVVHLFLDEMVKELGQGNRLEFRDFGVFEIKYRKPRQAQNPKTLERVTVPARRTVKFKIGRLMRQQLQAMPAPDDHAVEVVVVGDNNKKPSRRGKTRTANRA